MMTPKRRHSVGPALLAALGIAVMLTGIGLHWWRPDIHHEVEWVPQLIGAAIAFAGFYAMDPSRAKDGGGFLVDAGTRIVGVIRTGQRASDPVVTVTKSDEASSAPTVELPISDLELPPPDVPPIDRIPAKERGDL